MKVVSSTLKSGANTIAESGKDFPILVLDGGGSKGVYTLGVLLELEKRLEVPLHEYFKLIYGTSTGAIIAALLGLGYSVSEIKRLYFKYIPKIMGQSSRALKSKMLAELCEQVYGNKTFTDFKTNVGIVAVNYTQRKPLIFKSSREQVHSQNFDFKPGFGCSISDAVQASCSAYPIFEKKELESSYHGKITAIDGGFLAKNATLYALIDAERGLNIPREQIEVLSLGTGIYSEKPIGGLLGLLNYFGWTHFVKTLITSSNNANEELLSILYQGVKITRINNSFKGAEYATNMVEKDQSKLGQMFHLGRYSYYNREGMQNNQLQSNLQFG